MSNKLLFRNLYRINISTLDIVTKSFIGPKVDCFCESHDSYFRPTYQMFFLQRKWLVSNVVFIICAYQIKVAIQQKCPLQLPNVA